jgi:hypothetical protein
MPHFVMLTRLVGEEVNPSDEVRRKACLVSEAVRKACPDVTWVADYALLGPVDYLDIFDAPNLETAMKVSTLVRSLAGAHTEVWPALEWNRHDEILQVVAEYVSAVVA